ncbi:MAG: bifunctional metallophosphatase/5'-nucleotidase [Deltaproteobacteria bacterium]|nr:bifunctional metallophosphatase/5'-nucleotidase [Deltaproteobacteria bacterium]
MLPIYVDMDDVIASTVKAFIEIVKREFGKTVTHEQITDFDLKKSFQLTQSEYEHLFEVAHRPDEILAMDVIDGAIEVLTSWSDKGHPISIVTGRLTSTYDASLEWLSKHEVPFDSFIIVDKYSRPGMDDNIAITLDQLSGMAFELAVEDSAAMAAFLANDMDTPVALLDRPWNREINSKPNLKRYSDWQDLKSFELC